MKNLRFRSQTLALSAAVAVGLTSTSQAANIVISGTSESGNQAIIDFFNNNFTDVTSVTHGDYSNPANIPANTDVFVIGRILGSGAYDNAANSNTFNGLTIPIISFTSFVSRTAGARWSWHSGGAADGTVNGNETAVTASGASVFGVTEGSYDWWSVGTANEGVPGTGFNTLGDGTGVGQGTILATNTDRILAAYWSTGQLTAGGVAAGAPRLLFNLPDIDRNAFSPGGLGLGVIMPTQGGDTALANAVAFTTGLTVIPEPSSSALLLGGLGALALRRRRA